MVTLHTRPFSLLMYGTEAPEEIIVTISGAKFTDEGVTMQIAELVKDVYPEMSADSIVERAFRDLEYHFKGSAVEIEKVEMELTCNQSVAVVRY